MIDKIRKLDSCYTDILDIFKQKMMSTSFTRHYSLPTFRKLNL